MRLLLAALAVCALVPIVGPTAASAQATCRAKCGSEESACLQRTNNKSQCGGKAQACLAKCK